MYNTRDALWNDAAATFFLAFWLRVVWIIVWIQLALVFQVLIHLYFFENSIGDVLIETQLLSLIGHEHLNRRHGQFTPAPHAINHCETFVSFWQESELIWKFDVLCCKWNTTKICCLGLIFFEKSISTDLNTRLASLAIVSKALIWTLITIIS